MKRVLMISVLCMLLPGMSWAQMTAKEIIQKIDDNQVFDSQAFKAQMIIQKGKRTLTKTFYGYGKKEGGKSFMEFTNPEDKGVKYLKMDDELWIYFPDADDVMKISGHMLRQGMMGSDLSYEDMLENDSLDEQYASQLKEDVMINDRPCYVVELIAKVPDVSYAKQILFVDKQWYLPVKIEMYARGGRLLKEMIQSKIEKNGNRWVAMEGSIQDKRKRNSMTTFKFTEIEFDKPLPKKIFTKQNLKR